VVYTPCHAERQARCTGGLANTKLAIAIFYRYNTYPLKLARVTV
jgi:hypothetical protein